MTAVEDHYATLGLSREATAAELKRAYRQRSRDLHPDRNDSPDANRQQAAVNRAYALLSDSVARRKYDAERPAKARRAAAGPPVKATKMRQTYGEPSATSAPPRPAATLPRTGRGALQPEHLPDWYEFLDLHMNASGAEVVEALNKFGAELRLAGYSEADEGRVVLQLRAAAAMLTNPRMRAIYDAALCGTPPAPGTCPRLHRDWYTFLGVRPKAPPDRIAEQVTALSASTRKNTPEYREIEAAWRTLRDPDLRAAYDAALAAYA